MGLGRPPRWIAEEVVGQKPVEFSRVRFTTQGERPQHFLFTPPPNVRQTRHIRGIFRVRGPGMSEG